MWVFNCGRGGFEHVIMVEMKRPIAPNPNAVAKLSSSRTTPRAASCASLAALNWSNSLHVRVQSLLLRF